MPVRFIFILFCSMQCTEPNIVGVLSNTQYRFIDREKKPIEFLVRTAGITVWLHHIASWLINHYCATGALPLP